jgi:hypothetical protein
MSSTAAGSIRIALTYFSALPLMRWTNGAGLAMILGALALRMVSHRKEIFEASAGLTIFGGLLFLLPWLLGGGMMRAASTRAMLHQRPWGRHRMLLGATLVVTLMAAALTLLMLSLDPDGIRGVSAPPWAGIAPLPLFAMAWTLTAMTWVATFIAAGNLLLSALIGFVPLMLVKFGRTIVGFMPDASTVFFLGVILWAAFSLWYLLAPSIRPGIHSRARMGEAYDNPVSRFFQWAMGTHRNASRARATDQYLLGGAARGQLLLGVILILIAALIHLVLGPLVFTATPDLVVLRPVAPLFLAPVIIITSGAFSFALTRRARILWLRAGLDRVALFRRVERTGIMGAALSFGPFMVGALLYSIMIWPAYSNTILAFLVAQIAFLVCLFYGGLSLTRGWSAVDALLCIGLAILFAVEVTLLQPWSNQPNAAAPLVVGALLALALLLRWHARRRWLLLDWRVARMLQLPMRA